ncbi:uncharacterized protein MELLADRAFT_106960 [Melampsora larici-populina 98AG31]|uniref:CxC1-like cysteine cluster associated with KDZ transposases domain-containing protein n=1 Tax=Melampsora larici-populina (strain 98AG31 / pathotype 3-4-7) TaxID=747676 RepID=F4RN74_MELLP|nr:uncharacterized protein MELLADRAFT_106960 [Melampsora larici-populina 98AG31]EGG06268.1 hypothetical protein MELLADRAFT_106960 [Melampsora larici-populina 98AG31]
MPRNDYRLSGYDADMFGNRRTRQRQNNTAPPGMTRPEALRIAQELGFLERPTPLLPSATEDDNDGWEDTNDCIHEEITDFSGDQYASHQKSLRHAEARARRQQKWKALETQLTATYLHLQYSTCNWTKPYSYLSNEVQCKCPSDKLRRQRVDLIDLLSHTRRRQVTFCGCLPDVIHLLHLGYIAGSPHKLEKDVVACRETDNQANNLKLRELYPDKFIGVLYDIGCHLDVHIAKVNEGAGTWLQKRFQNAVKVSREAQSALNSLFDMDNPALPGNKYSADFFRGQWASEREAYTSKQAVLLKQQLELGRLLSLQDELEAEWLKPMLTPEQVLARLWSTADLKERIDKQAAKVGTANVLGLENEQKAFLKLWYSKHEVGLKYIAICEEKRPLQQSRTDGHESNLGHKGKTNLLVALRKHVTQLKKVVETYQTRWAEYHAEYPHHQLPENIDYNDLIHIQADHPFWNDSLFTKLEAPWAVDPKTRHGMQQVAYADRATEELRRLGWEARRAMCWAITSHNQIWRTLLSLKSVPNSDPILATTLTSHPTLSCLPPLARQNAATVVINNRSVKMANLQLMWNEGLLEPSWR